ncbi:MAG: hypothetical protein KUG77_29115 [Nannocystaceae bacterium]|nr:hypothetical protein [Nannocystaceae bacterium]
MRGWLAGCSVLLTGCVVVSEPNVELAGTTGLVGTQSSTGLGLSSSESSSSSGDSGSESGGPPPVVPLDFEVLWAVSPSDVVPPRGSAGTIRTDVYGLPPVGFGAHPGALKDREPLYAEVEAVIELAVPDPDAGGFGVLPRPWVPAWCAASEAVRDGFAASTYGQGLSGDDLEAAYEAAALEILLETLSRARLARPKMAWGFRGIPAPEYWRIVEREEDAMYEPWRTCNVASTAARELWNAVDFTAPELRYFYPVTDNGDHNASYVARWVEAMRLADKPVFPVFSGRIMDSNTLSPPPPTYVGLPYYPEDVELVLTELRSAGAGGLIYELAVEGCWDFENDGCPPREEPAADSREAFEDYWMSSFSPVLATFDEM